MSRRAERKMITIYINNNVSDKTISKINKFMERQLFTNCDLSGSEYEIERAEHTYIESEREEELSMVKLHREICDIIDMHEGVK